MDIGAEMSWENDFYSQLDSGEQWCYKPIYLNSILFGHKERHMCEDTENVIRRIYGSSGPKPPRFGLFLAYLYFGMPVSCNCTCGTCSGWRR